MKTDYNFRGPTLKEILYFEVISFLGRKFKKRSSLIKKSQNAILLDVGAGSNYCDGWLHVDFYLTPRLKFWKKYPKRKTPEIQMDLRFPFNCDSNIIDGIYSGHTLEHMWPNEAQNLLKELYRILKPGAWLRINVPDIEKYIEFYNGKFSSPEFEQYTFGCEAISIITQNYGHHSSWDFQFLKYMLEKNGFTNVRKVEFGVEGSDQRLIKEESVRKWETLVVEARKIN